jgi:transcriptional regulator
MYVPRHFAVEERSSLLRFIEDEPFGTLVSHVDGSLFATHAPFVILDDSPVTKLGVHVARANPQWKSIDGQDVLAIFRGAHGMVSAGWYANPEQSVPTWNYSAVHCSGKARLLDGAGTRRIIESLVERFETAWRIDDASAEYIAQMEKAIVGIAIAVTSIDGKFKHSQNRSPEDQRRVIESLTASECPGDRELATQMRLTLGLAPR